MQGQSTSIFSIILFENMSRKAQLFWNTAKQQRCSRMRSPNPSQSTDIRNWLKEWDYVGSQKHNAITNLKHKRQMLEKWECWIIPSYLPTMSHAAAIGSGRWRGHWCGHWHGHWYGHWCGHWRGHWQWQMDVILKGIYSPRSSHRKLSCFLLQNKFFNS